MLENDAPDPLPVAAFRNQQRNSQLLSHHPSMLTYDRYTHTIQASIEILNPCRDSMLRRTHPRGAIVNLVATICGGGVLSLPFAFEHAGIVYGTAMMIFSAVITDFSLYILCSCARRTGGRSYADVALVAFGPLAEMATTVLLFLLLIFMLVAYIVLVQDVWTPILLCVLPVEALIPYDVSHLSEAEQQGVAGNFVSLLALALVSPFLLKRDLHGLRHTCYVGLCSACLLASAIVYRAAQRNIGTTLFQTNVKLYATSWADVLFAFPIIVLSFMCCYNVLAVHGGLVNPSRERLQLVIHGSMVTVLCLFYTIGLFGYLCAYEDTQDNIFLNFDMSDHVFFLGRAGYAVTLTLAMPLVMLPCREALLSLPEQWRNRVLSAKMKAVDEGPLVINGVNFDEEMPLLSKSIAQYDSAESTTTSNLTLDPPTFADYVTHVGSTALIVGVAYVGAVAVPGVAIVWSICGSFMAILIAFFIPSACYLKIRYKKGITLQSVGAACLLVFSGVACTVCTTQTIWRMQQ
jgi:amino acid permease